MGTLREKAQAEQVGQQVLEDERRRERVDKRKRQQKEREQPVADYLTTWSGEQIDVTELAPMLIDTGPPRWTITIDDFKLRITAIGQLPEPMEVCIEHWFVNHQNHGGWRDVKTPKDLLAGPS